MINQEGTTKNVFKLLDDKSALWLMGFCLATNDIIHCNNEIHKHGDEEKVYYFVSCLSILREIAKLIESANKTDIKKYFSEETKEIFVVLENDLKPFDDATLTKSTLKPIRDITFHYDYLTFKTGEYEKLLIPLKKIRDDAYLSIRVNTDSTDFCRYTFADFFRNEFTNRLLKNDAITKITKLTAKAVAFADRILFDLTSRP